MSSFALSQQQVVAHLRRIVASVEQFLGGAAEDVAGNEVVATLTDDSNGVTHLGLRATIDNRIISDSAADAVFELKTPIQRVEDLAIGDAAVAAADKRHGRAAFR